MYNFASGSVALAVSKAIRTKSLRKVSQCTLEWKVYRTLTKHIVKHAGTEATILLKHLVDDIPRINLSLVAGQQGSDVVLHDRGQSGLIPDGGNPAWELRVPHCSMSSDQDVVVFGKLKGLVCLSEVEVALGALRCIPLQ